MLVVWINSAESVNLGNNVGLPFSFSVAEKIHFKRLQTLNWCRYNLILLFSGGFLLIGLSTGYCAVDVFFSKEVLI